MVLQLFLSSIPIFYLSLFNLLVGVGKHLDNLTRRFLSKGSRLGEERGMVLMSWDVVCTPIFICWGERGRGVAATSNKPHPI